MTEHSDREEEILQDALRIPSGSERDAYLDQACAGDEKMRREIEELLAAASKPASAIRRVGDLAALMDTYNIFQIARELPEADRAAYLEELCHDAEQREHLERMLADDWFRGVGEDEDDAVAIAEGPGSVIGAYKLLEKIGEGAFGVVFMAEQRGELPRRVALKIIKEGMDTREVIARFEAERRALALMEHSHIAKVFDAGATETGRPYFVMELVRGVPITQFCDEKKHTIRQRLALFMAVCDAVTHAHQKGIIHRDLKPSNILVGLDGDKPVPKVIDFGIAKATQQRLTEKTYFTSFKQFIGTFPYLCPEQSDISALDVDTRADIYALGVVLYELLAGRLPFDPKTLGQADFEAMRRVVRDEEPLKPSTQVATLQSEERRTVETSHGAEMDKLQSLIHGDLDWIVMKAMEKDRERRYETANAFRRDVERFLNDEPVEAGPPGALYKVRKFARRNRAQVGVAAVVAVLLVAGITSTTWFAGRADSEAEKRHQAEVAQREAVRLRGVAESAVAQKDRALDELEVARLGEAKAKKSARAHQYFRTIDLAYREWKEGNQPAAAERLEQCPEEQRSWEWYYLQELVYPRPLTTLALIDEAIENARYDSTWSRLYCLLAGGEIRSWSIEWEKGHFGFTLVDEPVPNEVTEQMRAAASKAAPAGGLPTTPAVSLPEPERPERPEQFGRRGGRVVTGQADGDISIHDGSKKTQVLRGWGIPITSLAADQSGQKLVSGDETRSITLWNIGAAGEKLRGEAVRRCLAGGPLAGLGYQNANEVFDDDLIIAVRTDGTVQLWAAEEPAKKESTVFTEKNLGTGHPLYASLAFSPDGKKLAVISNVSLSSFVFPTGELLYDIPMNGARLSYDPAGSRIVATHYRGHRVHILDAHSGSLLHKINTPQKSFVCAFDHKGRLIVPTAGTGKDKNGKVAVWDLSTSKPEATAVMADPIGFSAVAVSPCGTYLAAARGRWMWPEASKGASPEIWLWDLKGERFLGKLKGHHPSCIWCLAFSPDGKWLASGAGYYKGPLAVGELKLWDLEARSEKISLAVEERCIYALRFTPDSKRLVSSGSMFNWRNRKETFITFWEVEEGTEVFRLQGHQGAVTEIDFSPDGAFLASASSDGTVRIWKAPGFAERDPVPDRGPANTDPPPP